MPVSAPDRRIGIGQTWQDVTGSRVGGTTYTNTTGRPIEVYATSSNSASAQGLTLTVNGLALSGPQVASNNTTTVCGIVPPGGTYSVTVTLGALARWVELR